jgi:hypothetical protein
MADAPGTLTIPAVHQDQVVVKPPGAQVLACSEFCEYAALAYDDVGVSFQGHPEFSEDYQRDLLEFRFKGLAPDEVIAKARQSFEDRVSDSGKCRPLARPVLLEPREGTGRARWREDIV